MKKRNIFLGVALATAFVFSLTSCTKNNNNKKTNSNTNVITTTNPIGYTTTKEDNKYNISFVSDYGIIPADIKDVSEIPNTLPTLTDDDYKFIGWTEAINDNSLVVPGTKINNDITLYAIWEIKTNFDRFNESEDIVYSTEFSDTTIASNEDDIYEGIKMISDSTDDLKVEIENGKLVIKDTDSKNAAAAKIFHKYIDSGILEAFLTVNVNDSTGIKPAEQDIVQFYGFLYDNIDLPLFSLKSSTIDGDLKLGLITPDTPSYDQDYYSGNLYDWQLGEDLEIYYKYDFDKNLFTLKVNDNIIVEDFELGDYQPLYFTGIGFSTTDASTTRTISVSNYAIKNSNALTLEETKTKYSDLLDSYVSYREYKWYKILYDDMINLLATEKEAIKNASTIDEVIKMFSNSKISEIKSDYDLIKSALAKLTTYVENYKGYYRYNAKDFRSAITTINNNIVGAESKKQYEEWTDFDRLFSDLSFFDIDSDRVVRSNKIEDFQIYAGDVISNMEGIISSTDDLKYIKDKIGEIIEKKINLSYSSETLANCDILDIDSVLDDSKERINGICNYVTMDLSDLITYCNNCIISMKNKGISDFNNAGSLVNYFQDINTLPTDYSSKDALINDYENLVNDIDRYRCVCKWKCSLVDEIYEYLNEKTSELLIGIDKFNSDYTSVSSEIESEIESKIYQEVADHAFDENFYEKVDSIKNEIDNFIANIKNETECVITLDLDGGYFSDETSYRILKSTKTTINKPRNPKKPGFVFLGWYVDDTEFCFTNIELTNDTIVKAKWSGNSFEARTIDSTNWLAVAGDNTTVYDKDGLKITSTKISIIDECGPTGNRLIGFKLDTGKTITIENNTGYDLTINLKVIGNGDNKTLINENDETNVIEMNAKAYVVKELKIKNNESITYRSSGGVFIVSFEVS